MCLQHNSLCYIHEKYDSDVWTFARYKLGYDVTVVKVFQMRYLPIVWDETVNALESARRTRRTSCSLISFPDVLGGESRLMIM